jgi:hypothetical protein
MGLARNEDMPVPNEWFRAYPVTYVRQRALARFCHCEECNDEAISSGCAWEIATGRRPRNDMIRKPTLPLHRMLTIRSASLLTVVHYCDTWSLIRCERTGAGRTLGSSLGGPVGCELS